MSWSDAEVPVADHVSIAEGNCAGFPAPAIVATRECTDGVKKLMMRISLPLRGFATAGHDNTRAIRRAAFARGDGGGEVHDGGYRTEHTGAVMHEADKLAHVGLAAQVDDVVKRRVVISFCADLDEEDLAAEMIDHGLPALGGPPLNSDVRLPARSNDPIRDVLSDD